MVEARSPKPLRVCDGCLAAVGAGGGGAAPAPAGGLAQPDLEPEPEPEPRPRPRPQPAAVAEAVPVLAVSRRTFATSNFRAAYREAEVPEGPLEVGVILNKLLESYATHCAQCCLATHA